MYLYNDGINADQRDSYFGSNLYMDEERRRQLEDEERRRRAAAQQQPVMQPGQAPTQQQPAAQPAPQQPAAQPPRDRTFAEMQAAGQARPAAPAAAPSGVVQYTGPMVPSMGNDMLGLAPEAGAPGGTSGGGTTGGSSSGRPPQVDTTGRPMSPQDLANAPDGSEYTDSMGKLWVKRGGVWGVLATTATDARPPRGYESLRPLALGQDGGFSSEGLRQFLSQYGIPDTPEQMTDLANSANMSVEELQAFLQANSTGPLRFESQRQLAQYQEQRDWMRANGITSIPNGYAYVPASEGGPGLRRYTYDEAVTRGYNPYGGRALYDNPDNIALLERNQGLTDFLNRFGVGRVPTPGTTSANVAGGMAPGPRDQTPPRHYDNLGLTLPPGSPTPSPSPSLGPGPTGLSPNNPNNPNFGDDLGDYMRDLLNRLGPSSAPTAPPVSQDLMDRILGLQPSQLPPMGGMGATGAGTAAAGGMPTPPSSGGTSAVGRQTAEAILQALANPSAFDNEAVMQLYNRLGQNIDDQFTSREQLLREEMAGRGLSDSSIQGGRLADLNIGRRNAMTELATQLGIERARDFAQARAQAIQMGLAQRGQEFNEDEARGRLQLNYDQLMQARAMSDADRALQAELGRGNLGINQQRLGLEAQGQSFAQQLQQLQFQNMLGQQGFTNQLSSAELQRLLNNDVFGQRMGLIGALTGYGQSAFENDLRQAEFNRQLSNDTWNRYLQSILLGWGN